MKLVIAEFLRTLKERDELDRLLSVVTRFDAPMIT